MLGWVGIVSYFLLAFGFGYYLVRPVQPDI
jgi:hypothetical protein